MSRLKQYLVDSTTRIKVPTVYDNNFSMESVADIDRFMKEWEKVKKECQPYLKFLRKHASKIRRSDLLCRGMADSADFREIVPRTDRMPKDTPEEWHYTFDEAFDEVYGLRARTEGIFCTANYSTADGYGRAYIIFPTGNYEYLWSDDITDLYNTYRDEAPQEMEMPDAFIDELTSDYEEMYGEGQGYGRWVLGDGRYKPDREKTLADEVADWFDNNETRDESLNHAIQEFLENDVQFNIDKYEEREEELSGPEKADLEELRAKKEEVESEDFYGDMIDRMNWIPEDTLEDYLDNNRSNFSHRIGEYGDTPEAKRWTVNAIKGKYKKTDLEKLLADGYANEITLFCKKYYAFRRDRFISLIKYVLFIDPDTDPRQLSFDLGDK